MIIVVTGTVGIDKKHYLEEVCSLAAGRGIEILLCNVGDMMYAEAPDISAGRILDIPLKRLHNLRRSVMKDIIARSRKVEHVIVNTHATFRWRHGLFRRSTSTRCGSLMRICTCAWSTGWRALHVRLTESTRFAIR